MAGTTDRFASKEQFLQLLKLLFRRRHRSTALCLVLRICNGVLYNAFRNIVDLLSALKTGDLELFIKIAESEAMQLHALMMCSKPSVLLLKPNTLRIINTLYEFRRETDIPVCFTLDAGPNVHLLYPDQHAEMVERFIMDELEPYCHEGQWIADHVGDGPSKI